MVSLHGPFKDCLIVHYSRTGLMDISLVGFFLLIFIYLFIYLAAPGLSLQHTGYLLCHAGSLVAACEI